MSKPAAITIETVLQTRYGVTAESADALTIEWAAEHLADLVGTEKAAAGWKRLNARRYKMGRYTDIPRFGSKLHAAYFAK